MCSKVRRKNLELNRNHLRRVGLKQEQNLNTHSPHPLGLAKVVKISIPTPAQALQHREVRAQGSQEVARCEEIQMQEEHLISVVEAPELQGGLLMRLIPIELPKERHKAEGAPTAH